MTEAGLRDISGREPKLPLSLMLDDGRNLVLHTLLRVLPNKRLTGIGTLGDQSVFAKLFIAPSGAKRHWERECNGLQLLRESAIPVPRLLATGRLAGKEGYYLLTEHLAAGNGISALDDAALPAAFQLLGRMHAAGLVQRDAHLGNFLRDDKRTLAVDGGEVRRVTGAKDFLENLALLFAQLPANREPSLRDALLEAYRAGGGCVPTAEKQLADGIHAARALRQADYLDKCLRNCTLFRVEKSWGRFVAMLRTEDEFLSPILADPDRWLAQGTPLKQGRTATLARVDHLGRRLVIKRYNIKSAGHAVSRSWRPSRAWHSWRAAHLLGFLGIATPKPLALIENRLGPLRGRAWLITEYCPGARLTELCAESAIFDDHQRQAVAELFHQLAAARISHGDLKAANLLWHEGRFVLIDLDAMRQHHNAASFARAWRRDRDRFLRNWPAGSVLHEAFDNLLQLKV